MNVFAYQVAKIGTKHPEWVPEEVQFQYVKALIEKNVLQCIQSAFEDKDYLTKLSVYLVEDKAKNIEQGLAKFHSYVTKSLTAKTKSDSSYKQIEVRVDRNTKDSWAKTRKAKGPFSIEFASASAGNCFLDLCLPFFEGFPPEGEKRKYLTNKEKVVTIVHEMAHTILGCHDEPKSKDAKEAAEFFYGPDCKDLVVLDKENGQWRSLANAENWGYALTQYLDESEVADWRG